MSVSLFRCPECGGKHHVSQGSGPICPVCVNMVPVEPVAQISVTDDYWGDIHLAPGRYAVVEIGGDE